MVETTADGGGRVVRRRGMRLLYASHASLYFAKRSHQVINSCIVVLGRVSCAAAAPEVIVSNYLVSAVNADRQENGFT